MTETTSTGRPNPPAGTDELAARPRPGEHEQRRFDAEDHLTDGVDQDGRLDDQDDDRLEGRPLGADDRMHHAERMDHPGDMDGDGHPDRGDLMDRDDPNREGHIGPEGHAGTEGHIGPEGHAGREGHVGGEPQLGREGGLDHDGQLDRDRMHHDGDRELHDGAAATHVGGRGTHPTPADHAATSLFGDADVEGFRARWMQLQAMFVDEPRAAVQQADQLVAEVMQNLATMFARNKHELEGQWQREGAADTEDLRQALRRYRTFFDQLIGRH